MSARPELSRDQLVSYLDELLAPGDIADACPNGLQVSGRDTIRRLVTGVSACQELFVRAREKGADALLVHHGLLWNGDPLPLTGLRYRRIAELIRSEMSLIAYHLPLDRHPELGNNAIAARRLGLADPVPFGHHQGLAIGCGGRYPRPLELEEFLDRCRRLFDQEPLAFAYGPPRIDSVAIVSGAAERLFFEAIDGRFDLFLTGEASEWVMNVARESRTHFVAAGHYATERLGVQAVGAHLQRRFGLAVDFIDVPNPV